MKNFTAVLKTCSSVVLLASTASFLSFLPYVNAACVTTGNVVNCSGDRDASHRIDFGNSTGVDTIVVDPNSTLTDTNNDFALIAAGSSGDGDLSVVIGQGTRAIGSTTGSVARRGQILLLSRGNRERRTSGDMNVLVEEDTHFTTGTGGSSAGVRVYQENVDGEINVEVRGEMETLTLGTENHGGYFHNQYINITSVNSAGDITAQLNGAKYTSGSETMPGTNAHAASIHKINGSGTMYLGYNDAEVNTHGAWSHGAYMLLQRGFIGDGIIDINNTDINVLETSARYNSYGVFLNNLLDRTGRKNTSNSIVRIKDSNVRVTQQTEDNEAIGIFVAHHADGDVFLSLTDSAVDVTSSGAEGIGATVRVLNQQAEKASDIDVQLVGGSLIFNNTGGADNTAALAVNHEGQGDINILQTSENTITVNGDNADGIYVQHNGPVDGLIVVDVDGQTTVNGADGHALHIENTNQSDYQVNIGPNAIYKGGSGSGAALKTEAPGNGAVLIQAGALLDGTSSGIAIRDGDRDGDGVDEIGGNIVVDSSGTINGDVILGLGNDTFRISGGEVNGDIFGDDKESVVIGAAAKSLKAGPGGDDTLVFQGGSFNGTFFGQGGDDTVLVTGAPNFTGAEVFDGGEGEDLFIFENIDLEATGSNIREFENVMIDGGTVSFRDSQLNTGLTTITNGGRLDAGVSFNLMSDLFTTNGGVFDATGGGVGVYEITGNARNDGVITTSDGIVGDKVNIAGDYAGDGVFHADVDTDNDIADQLIIGGTSIGANTLVRVNNLATSGIGKDTGTGIGDGIPVVLVSGATSDADFALEQDLIVGPYEYKLNRENDNTFYLQSELLPQVVAAQSLPAVMRSSVTTVPSSPIRQTASLNTLRHNTNINTTLRERVGACEDFEYLDPNTGEKRNSCYDSYSWIRIEQSDLDMNLTQQNQQKFSEDQRYVHFGHDVELSALTGKVEPSNWFVGLNAAFGDSNLTVQGNEIAQVATVDKQFSGFGVSATRYGESGLYNDFILQYTDHDSEISSARSEHTVDGQNVALSLEIGKKIYMNADKTVSLTPQAQLMHSRTDFNAFVDDDGVVVSNDDGETTTSRFGILLEKREQVTEEMQIEGRQPNSAYVIGNLYANLDNKTAVNASGTRLEYEDHDSWIGVGLGGNINLRKDVNLFGEVAYNQSLDDFGDSEQISGTIGIRKTWKAQGR